MAEPEAGDGRLGSPRPALPPKVAESLDNAMLEKTLRPVLVEKKEQLVLLEERGRFEAGVGWRVRRRAGGGCDEAGRGRSLAPLRQFDGLEVARTRSKTPSCSTKVNEMLHLFDFWGSTNASCSRRGRVAGSLN